MGRWGSLGARALVAAWLVTSSACSTAPVFGEASGGAGTTSTTGPTTTTTTSAGPSTASQGGSGEGGGGGAGGAAGEGGAGGQGGEGGAGCVSDCGDRRCGLDACGRSCGPASDTWARNVPQSVSRLVLRPGTSDLLVVGDGVRIDRIDACQGGTVDGYEPASAGQLRGVGLLGDVLAAGVNAGDFMDAAIFLDADAMLLAPAKVALVPQGEPDRIWGGAVHDGALWLGLDDDGSALVRVTPEDGPRRFTVGLGLLPPGGRGVASSPFGLLHQQGDATLALVDTASCSAASCPATVSAPLATRGFQVTYAGGQAFVPALQDGRGLLTRVAVPSMATEAALSRDPSDVDDGFTDVAVHDGVLYVTGVTGGLSGSPWLLAYPPEFQTTTGPLHEQTLTGPGNIGWAVAADETGVYVAGSHENGGGFVVKCSHDLTCPTIASSVDR